MANPWDNDPIVQPAAPGTEPWANDPVVEPKQYGPPEQPTTVRGVAKNVGAAGLDFVANIGDFITNAGANLLHPLVVAGGTAYDALAPSVGLPRMTPEQRADLYGQPQPGEAQLPPEQQQPGTRLVNAVDAAIPGQTAATLPASPTEAAVRRGVAGGATTLALGPGGILPIIAGAAGPVAAPLVAENVPEWARPGTELAVNTVPQMLTGANASRGSSTVDVADAATAQLARGKYKIPINATDITPGSQFRTPASMQKSLDAFQGTIIKELGQDPNTSDLVSRNRITTGPGGVMERTATDVGNKFNDVASRTDISQMHTYNAITKLAAIDHGLDLEAGLTDANKAAIRRNIDLVQNAAAKGNGIISGADYQALTRTGTPLDRLASNSDPNVAAIGMQVKSALDDAFHASASAEDKAKLTEARYQWRLMKTVQPLVERAQGANIDPAAFAARAVAASRKLDGSTSGIAYTGGTISELARIGDLIGRGPAPVSPSVVGDLMHPPGGPLAYLMDPKLAAVAHGAQVVGRQVAGPYLRSGFNAQQVINNALYRPSLLQGILGGATSGAATNDLMKY